MSRNEFEAIAVERSQQLEWVTRMMTIVNGRPNALRHITNERGGLPCGVVRELFPTEVHALRSKRCLSSDWSKVQLFLASFDETNDQSVRLQELVSNTRFEGTVVLVLDDRSCSVPINEVDKRITMKTEEWIHMIPWGIHDCSVIANSILHVSTVKVHRSCLIADTYVKPWAVLLNCGPIKCTKQHQQQQRLSVTVGPETGGGRNLVLSPESTMIDVGRQLVVQQDIEPRRPNKAQHQPCLNVIGSYSVVSSTTSLDTIYLHDHCRIEDGGCIQNAILFPGSTIRTACTVTNVVMQWNSSVSHNSSVSDALIMEQSEVGPLGVVANTILGPDVHVSNGEIHASILGPNCNSHHQSLLLAVLWPTGRGNVGYGANVGSNHTGRIPDQECSVGEGTFWGLSCVIKFPVDLSAAPYSIIAAGTTLAPQRCTMPFSLIVNTAGTGETSIVPGWVLRHSPYTLVRSEHKFSTRRKAVRHAFYTGWKIIRPETIQLLVIARAALTSIVAPVAMYEGDRDLLGIGQNQLTESGRLGGIQVYTECIQRFALQGLVDFLVAAKARSKQQGEFVLHDGLRRELEAAREVSLHTRDAQSAVRWPVFPWDTDQSAGVFWKSQRALLVHEFPLSLPQESIGSRGPSLDSISAWAYTLLERYLKLETGFAQAVYKCKQRDDVRGMATIPDYSKVHVLADHDPVIIAVRTELNEKKTVIRSLLSELKAPSRL